MTYTHKSHAIISVIFYLLEVTAKSNTPLGKEDRGVGFHLLKGAI